MNEQLRRRSLGAPAARSILLTILGEYVLPRGEPVWQETLVSALGALGYTEHAARQALARSVRDGWLESERQGRRARVSLSTDTAELLRTGAERIYGFGEPWEWDGEWLMMVLRVPESRREVRHQLRTQLAWAGLGSLGGGVWLTPHADREAELEALLRASPAAEVVSFHGRIGRMGEPRRVAAAAWDLDAVVDQYRRFIAAFGRARASTPAACFRLQTELVHEWRRFPFLDPDLPEDLLHARWPRRRAHDLFRERHDRWGTAARVYFGSLEDGVITRSATGSV
ncbi:MAG TPA: PaaX family transcriptional regulator C-terminal domain-containing protein [Thermoleophilaceae bacterium]|nr:PaaX family transcriptional regulator C-terminal domain-containing protein [Thermoleophilaceae bacterium]